MRNEKIIQPGMGCPTLRTLPMMVSQALVLTARIFDDDGGSRGRACRGNRHQGHEPVGAKRLPSQACSIVPIAAARCMSTAPTMARGFLNIPVPIIPKFRVGHYALHNTVSMRVPIYRKSAGCT